MSNRPNLLLITTDQQRWDTLQAAGHAHMLTPNLDWLCDEGIRFDRAYADCPICIPARATIMTGLHATSHGTTFNHGGKQPIAGHPTLPGTLTAAGYQTRAQGKMHFHPARCHYGFETMEITPDYLRQMQREGRIAEAEGVQGIGNNQVEAAIAPCGEAHSLSRWTVDRSIDFLDTRDPTRPFFLWTSFFHPHPPFEPTQRFWDITQDRTLPDRVIGDWAEDWEGMSPALRRATVLLSGGHRLSAEAWRQSRRAYYACISQIDYALGRLFARLKELGELENTWILFTSDHGEMLGDHRLAAKAQPLEAAARVPMILRPPKSFDGWLELRGTSTETLAGLADILPTFLCLGGADLPEGSQVDGRNLLDLVQGKNTRDYFFFEVLSMNGVTDGTWKYLFGRSDGCELLFNIAEDPYETRNRLQDHPEVAQRLRAVLAEEMHPRHPQAIQGDRLVPTEGALDLSEFQKQRGPSFCTEAATSYRY